jgi:protein tyrosine phosphatase
LQQDKALYINASTVQYSHPSLPHTCSYIAAQGPLPQTAADFWAMVLEQQVPAVLMLTNCNEAGVVKCSQYFPNTLHSVGTPGSVGKAGSFEIKVSKKLTNAVG